MPLSRRHFLSTVSAAALSSWSLHARGETPKPTVFDAIEKSKVAGLNVLQPSQRDLQHGLELHADSLVFDSYGFSPNAAVDGQVLADAVNAGASDLELQDLEEDMRMTRYVTDPIERAERLAAPASNAASIASRPLHFSCWDSTSLRPLGVTSGSDTAAEICPLAESHEDM